MKNCMPPSPLPFFEAPRLPVPPSLLPSLRLLRAPFERWKIAASSSSSCSVQAARLWIRWMDGWWDRRRDRKREREGEGEERRAIAAERERERG